MPKYKVLIELELIVYDIEAEDETDAEAAAFAEMNVSFGQNRRARISSAYSHVDEDGEPHTPPSGTPTIHARNDADD